MKMQIVFDKPLYVSKDFKSREFMEITFVTKFFFFDTEGLFLEDNFKVRREIPTQIPLGGAT